jgi:Asp/Glu/hydantoin racemase
MPQTLALIHTSAIFLTRETMMQDILREVMPEVRLINIMDDSLLPDCMAVGEVTPETTRRMCAYVTAAEEAGADAVLSLCSSLGPAIDVARKLVRVPVVKIDDAHTEKAAREADRVGVMATVRSTLVPTVALIREKAQALGKKVEVVESLSDAAFDALLRGEREGHDAAVLAAARGLAPRVDAILFAQASMTRLAPAVQEATGRPVLTSPRLAIEYTKRLLDHLKNAKAAAG